LNQEISFGRECLFGGMAEKSGLIHPISSLQGEGRIRCGGSAGATGCSTGYTVLRSAQTTNYWSAIALRDCKN
jgi:hypothetical protein